MFKAEKSIHRFLLNREIKNFFRDKEFNNILELCAGNLPYDKFINFKNEIYSIIWVY